MDYEKARMRTELDALKQQVAQLQARVDLLEKPPAASVPEPRRPLFARKKAVA